METTIDPRSHPLSVEGVNGEQLSDLFQRTWLEKGAPLSHAFPRVPTSRLPRSPCPRFASLLCSACPPRSLRLLTLHSRGKSSQSAPEAYEHRLSGSLDVSSRTVFLCMLLRLWESFRAR